MTVALVKSVDRLQSPIEPSHTRRKAVVYVRQSTVEQVARHGESTKIQYGLRNRARLLGWADVDIEVIDEDWGVFGGEYRHAVGFEWFDRGHHSGSGWHCDCERGVAASPQFIRVGWFVGFLQHG